MLKTSNDQRKLLPNFEHLFATTAQAPGGVARLRELILTLAVQGKLVAQDPSDEPASELLKKIRAEKDRLIAEGKIKKDKPLAEITDEEKPFELPVGWEWVKLGEITNYGTPNKAKEITAETWVLDMEDVEKNTGRVLQKIKFKDRESLSDKNAFEKGDVIYGKLRPYLNKVLVADEDGVCTTEFVPVNSFGVINAEYLKISLSNPIFMAYVENKLYGMKMPRLGTTDARNAVISIPPLAEQSRIVARVEELMRLCDALEEKGRLEQTQHQQLLQAMLDSLTQTTDAQELARHWQRLAQHFDLLIDRPEAVGALEQTILQLAVRGLLVPQDPSDEPASELLKKIRAEKDRLIAEGKIKKDKPLPAVGEGEKPFDLPQGWAFVRLGDIAQTHTGFAFKSGQYTSEGTLVFRVTNIKPDGGVDLLDVKYISNEIALSNYKNFFLRKGDILLVMVGGSLGKIGVIDDSCLPAVLNQNMWKIVGNELVLREYLIEILKYINKNQLKITNSTHGHLAQGEYLLQAVALPPLAEQSRIVARVTELRALCQQLRDKLTQARTTQTQLAQAWVEQVAG